MLVACVLAALAAVIVFRLALPPEIPKEQPDRLWIELTFYLNWLSITALLMCSAVFALGLVRVVAGVYGVQVPVDKILTFPLFWFQNLAFNRYTPGDPSLINKAAHLVLSLQAPLVVGVLAAVGAVMITMKNFFWSLKHA